MIEFMVIGLPRSGTTWAANWLCTDRTHCIHDALNLYHYEDFDKIPADKILGVAETGLWMFPEWVNRHPARKVILHRDVAGVQASLEAVLGLGGLPTDASAMLDKIEGMHRPWTDLFDGGKAREIYDHLTGGLPFDMERHAELETMNITPHLWLVRRDPEVGRRLVKKIMKDLEGR